MRRAGHGKRLADIKSSRPTGADRQPRKRGLSSLQGLVAGAFFAPFSESRRHPISPPCSFMPASRPSSPAGAGRCIRTSWRCWRAPATPRPCSSRRPAAARRWRASCRPWSSWREDPRPGLHTLYVSPLKALAADIRRNLARPVEELGLAIRIEDRTGDTAPGRSARRQRVDPPHILLTTPEMPRADAELRGRAAHLRRACSGSSSTRSTRWPRASAATSSSLGLARLAGPRARPAPRRPVGHRRGPAGARPLPRRTRTPARSCYADPGPDARHLDARDRPSRRPGPAAAARYAIPRGAGASPAPPRPRSSSTTPAPRPSSSSRPLAAERRGPADRASTTARSSREQRGRGSRRRWSAGALQAIVCTGSLDLGIDWGDVDLVIQVGAPKNVKRLVQRIGRANHRYNAPSKAILVPANRFEVLECARRPRRGRARATSTASRAAPGRSTCSASTSC